MDVGLALVHTSLDWATFIADHVQTSQQFLRAMMIMMPGIQPLTLVGHFLAYEKDLLERDFQIQDA